jgi:hypothetical protein
MKPETQNKWVLAKWEWLTKYSDPDKGEYHNVQAVKKAIPELEGFLAGCAYCTEYCNCTLVLNGDKACPINQYDEEECCHLTNSTYIRWVNATTKANAKRMLNLLKRVIKHRNSTRSKQ